MSFDVFLCHNSQDKPEVKEIAEKLKQQGLKPWLDVWELRPGLPWQPELERQIENIKAAAVFVGASGIGPWQEMEIGAYLRRFVKQGSPVIPVLLPNAPEQPKLPIFLEGMIWVDFRGSQSDPIGQLIWGITGIKPQPIATETPKPPIIEKPRVELKSEKGVDYTKLRDLLAEGKWKEADQETGKVMCQAAGRESAGWLDIENIDNFPCEDLRTINQLWLHHSNGKFGFSVQKEIYESLGGTRDYNEEVWKDFGDRVGWGKGGKWLNYSNLTFNLDGAPPAHLPVLGLGGLNFFGDCTSEWGLGVMRFGFSLLSRAKTCNL